MSGFLRQCSCGKWFNVEYHHNDQKHCSSKCNKNTLIGTFYPYFKIVIDILKKPKRLNIFNIVYDENTKIIPISGFLIINSK